jgi:hypothetical protein
MSYVEDGSNILLRNVGTYTQMYAGSYPRRLQSSTPFTLHRMSNLLGNIRLCIASMAVSNVPLSLDRKNRTAGMATKVTRLVPLGLPFVGPIENILVCWKKTSDMDHLQRRITAT